MRRLKTMSMIEDIPPNEPAERREVAKLTGALQQKRKAFPSNGDQILRGVHPKSHGCVNARFIVNRDLRRDLRVGLFREPGKVFKAKIRYSNADVLILPDLIDGVNRSRGMAIKIMDVGRRTLRADKDAMNQDFLMINTPEFAFANVRDYLRLSRALMADPTGDNPFGADPKLFFLPLELLGAGALGMDGKLTPLTGAETPTVLGMRQIFEHSGIFDGFTAVDLQNTMASLGIVKSKIELQTVRNPIEVPYFGAAPFRFGRNKVMRVSVAPLSGAAEQAPFTADELKTLDPDFLARALKQTVTSVRQTRLSFRLQIATLDQIEGRVGDMIENASMGWDETEFPHIEVAQIVVPRVRGDRDLVDACKGEFFTPWHSLAAHRPLGGINRLRRPVYNRSSAKRLQKPKILRPFKVPKGAPRRPLKAPKVVLRKR